MESIAMDDKIKPSVGQFIEDVEHSMVFELPALKRAEHEDYSIVQTLKAFWKCFLYANLLGIGAMFDCFALSMPNNIIANAGFIQRFGTVFGPTGAVALDPDHISLWTLFSLLGAVFGLASGSLISDRFGRKVALYCMSICLAISIVLSLVANSWGVWGAGRILAGTGAGLLQSSYVVWVAEIAPSKARGVFLSIYSLFWGLGGMSAAIALYVAELSDPLDWRAPIYASLVFLGLFVPGLIFAPESPWFYARKGDEERAKRSMRRLYGNVSTYDVDYEYAHMHQAIVEERSQPGESALKAYGDCFRGTNRRRTMIAGLPIIIQAFSGVFLFFGFTSFFFQAAGYSKPFEATMIVWVLQISAVIVSFFLLDRFGRRSVLIAGMGLCTICCWVIGGLGFATSPNGTAMLAITCVWVFVYSCSLGPLGYTFLGEIATQRLKSKTGLIGFGIRYCFDITFSYLLPYMLSPLRWNWGVKTGLFFGGFSTIGFIAIVTLIPEVRGRTLPEVDELFEARVGARHFPEYKTKKDLAASSGRDA